MPKFSYRYSTTRDHPQSASKGSGKFLIEGSGCSGEKTICPTVLCRNNDGSTSRPCPTALRYVHVAAVTALSLVYVSVTWTGRVQ